MATQDCEYTKEAAERYTKFFGIPPEKDMKTIPKEKVGLGYQYYPILFHSKNKEHLKDFFNEISVFVGDRNGKEVKREYEKIKQEICLYAVQIGTSPMGYELGYKLRFFDPKEVDDFYEKFKKDEKFTFLGFMHAMDVCYLELKRTKYQQFFCQQTCKGKDFDQQKCEVIIGYYILKIHNNIAKDNDEARIFNWRMEVEVESLMDSMKKASQDLFGEELKEDDEPTKKILRSYIMSQREEKNDSF